MSSAFTKSTENALQYTGKQRFERTEDMITYFSLFFNTADVDAMESLIRDVCTADCCLSRYTSDNENMEPNKVLGLENILEYAILMTEAIPDSTLDFEVIGHNNDESTIAFGYTLTGTRFYEMTVVAAVDGLPAVGSATGNTMSDENELDLLHLEMDTLFEFSGVVTLLVNETNMISGIECRCLNGYITFDEGT